MTCLYSFYFEKAKLVSDESMRGIWASILAEEINAPNSISRSLIHTLSIIDKIYRFAEKKYEHKITMEKLNKYLSKSLAQISAKKKLEENEEEEV